MVNSKFQSEKSSGHGKFIWGNDKGLKKLSEIKPPLKDHTKIKERSSENVLTWLL